MTLLSDAGIHAALLTRQVAITPLLDGQVGPASVDLRLGRWVRVFNASTQPVDPFMSSTTENQTRLVKIERNFTLQPGEFILGSTVERVMLDGMHAGRLEGKSSLGRLGLNIHATAGFIDPGFDGWVTLEISNGLRRPILLYPGMLICQLAIWVLDRPTIRPYKGKYTHADPKPVASLYWMNGTPPPLRDEDE